MATRGRSALATVVGWLLVVVVVLVGLRFVVGTLAWFVRSFLGLVVIVGLFVVWLILKAPDDDDAVE
ncbi:MAG: hypothetical protein RLZZ362_1237 [Actinomycetota bacterium]|jgi:uncharacterized membrane protein